MHYKEVAFLMPCVKGTWQMQPNMETSEIPHTNLIAWFRDVVQG